MDAEEVGAVPDFVPAISQELLVATSSTHESCLRQLERLAVSHMPAKVITNEPVRQVLPDEQQHSEPALQVAQ